MNLRQLQAEQAEWARRNFGSPPSWHPLLGMNEELGELNHAHLKGAQGIRHTPAEIADMKRDAIGDILIYMVDYCTREGIDCQAAMEKTWAKVSRRDWKADPMGAGDE